MSLMSDHHGQGTTRLTGMYDSVASTYNSQAMAMPSGTAVAAIDPEGRQISQFWMPLPSNFVIDPLNPPNFAVPPGMFPPGTTIVPISSLHHSSHMMNMNLENRTRLTREQHQELEEHFLNEPKPTTNDKKIISSQFGVPLEKINNWFQNRRAKVKQDFRKRLMASALAKAGLDASTVNGVKGRLCLPEWMGGKSRSTSPKKDDGTSPGSTPPGLSRQPSQDGRDYQRFSGDVPMQRVPSSEPSRRLHPSISTPNFHSRPGVEDAPPMPLMPARPNQPSLDPRLLGANGQSRPTFPLQHVAGNTENVPTAPQSFPSSGVNGQEDQIYSHIKIEPSYSLDYKPQLRQVTPEQDSTVLPKLQHKTSTTALVHNMSMATLTPGPGRVSHGHSRTLSRISMSPTPSPANPSIATRRAQQPPVLRGLRNAASMSVLPSSMAPSAYSMNSMGRDIGFEPMSGGSSGSVGATTTYSPRKSQNEKTIRKVRSGIQKQPSSVGLSSTAKASTNAHSRSASVGFSTVSPRKQNRPALKSMPSMPNVRPMPIEEHPPVPPIPSLMPSNMLHHTVMPSQLINHGMMPVQSSSNIGIPSPPIAECDPSGNAIISDFVPNNFLGAVPSKGQHAPVFNPGCLDQKPLSLSDAFANFPELAQTNSPPTTPLHLHTMQQISNTAQQQPPSGLNSAFDYNAASSILLFDPSMVDSQMSDFGNFDGLSGLESMSSISGFGGFDPLTPVDLDQSCLRSGTSNDLLYSAQMSAAGNIATTLSMLDMSTGLNGNYGMPTSSFDYTPVFQLSDDPFVSPDLTH